MTMSDENNKPVGSALKSTTTADERPREKALQNGFSSLTTAELLAILVGSGTRGESVVSLCRRILLEHEGKLYRVARRTVKELVKDYRGIGQVKAIEILAALELARRYQLEQFDRNPRITSSTDSYNYLRPFMEHLPHEEFHVLLLNRANEVIHRERISSGGTSMTVVDVKMVLRPAIEHLASSIIIAHNHPSDNATPSDQDRRLTERIAQACRTMDIRLLDHIVVCRGGRYYSFNDHGEM